MSIIVQVTLLKEGLALVAIVAAASIGVVALLQRTPLKGVI
jgi:hypothetical protein